MKPEPFTILFANVGRRVGLIRAFGEAMRHLGLEARILGVDANPLSPAYYYSGHLIVLTSSGGVLHMFSLKIFRHDMRLHLAFT